MTPCGMGGGVGSSAVGSGGLFSGGDKKFQVSKPTKLTKTILSLSSIAKYGTQKSCYSRILTTRFLSDFRFVDSKSVFPVVKPLCF